MSAADWKRFAEVYNDTGKYPAMADIAVELGLSYQTVRNKASILRSLKRKHPRKYPKIIRRDDAAAIAISRREKNQISVPQHAEARAQALAGEVSALVTRSKYPVINPGAIRVESYVSRRYRRATQSYEIREGTPHTWLSDTLKVAPIKRYKNRTFFFAGAQNDAEVHDEFWENLHAYAADVNGEVVIGPLTYETQWWSENNPTARSYDGKLKEHLCFGQMKIGPNFVFCGEMNTLPTASKPISDLVTYSRGRWAVFPHAKRQLKSVPSTDPNVQAHQVLTTGMVTRPKVIPRKAGVKSIFHHVIGAVIVEFDADGDVFCRHLSANADGSFYDLDTFVHDGEVTRGHRARGLVLADAHKRKLGPIQAKAVFGIDLATNRKVTDDCLLDDLDPEEVFFHDIFDNQYANHHNIHDNAYHYEQAVRGLDSVFDEVFDAGSLLTQVVKANRKIVVVDSNHDLALERYVREGRYRHDGKNIRFGLQLEDAYLGYREEVARALDRHEPTPSFSVLEHAIRKQFSATDLLNVTWVYDGKSYRLDGVECGNHGFRGSNGARGTVSGFAKLGVKMNIGDKHSPEIDEGVFCSGTMELQHGYNKGPSGWARTHTIQYADGKRALITMQNGKYRGRR